MQGNEFSFDVEGKAERTSSPKDKLSFNLDPNVVESTPEIKAKPKAGRVKTGINVFRSFVALGVLTLPYAFSLTGLWLSVGLLAFTTWLSYYGVGLFLDIAEELGFNGPKVEDLCKLAGGRIYGKIGSVSIIVSQLSCAIASVVFTVDFMDYVFCHHNVEALCHHKFKFLAFSFIISSCIVMIENLACFAYISLISIVAILTSLATILYYDVSFVFDRTRPVAPYSLFKLGGTASFIGIALFAMEGIGMVFPIRASMKDNSRYRQLYAVMMVIVFAICSIFGFMCYLAIGDNVTSVIFYYFGQQYEFLFFLEILYGTAIFISYPVILTPVFEIIVKSERFGRFFQTDNVDIRNRRFMRLSTMIVVYVVCVMSPSLIDFMSLSGALFNSTLGFILPVILHNKFMGERGKLSKSRKFVNWVVLIVGGGFSLLAVIQSTIALLGFGGQKVE